MTTNGGAPAPVPDLLVDPWAGAQEMTMHRRVAGSPGGTWSPTAVRRRQPCAR